MVKATAIDWKKEVISVLEGSSSKIHVKELRKVVFLSLQIDEDDDDEKMKKQNKKEFKRAVKSLEEDDNKLSLSEDGIVSLFVKVKKSKSKDKDKKKDKKKKKEKESKKRKKDDDENETDKIEEEKIKKSKKEKTINNEDNVNVNEDKNDDEDEIDDDDENDNENGDSKNNDDTNNSASDKNKPVKGNTQGITRLFVGNLPFAVDETSLNEFLSSKSDGEDKVLEYVKWITDKETGQFYGSAFIEVNNSTNAMIAVTKLSNKKLMGRPIKINYAPVKRPGVDVWPPKEGGGKNTNSTTGATAGGKGLKAMGVKPENCYKLFIGNLSYEIDDDAISNFFDTVGAEIKAVRWLHHKDSGDFKGCGFVEFWKTEACEKAATLNGKNLLGRPIRIDWSD